MNILKQGGKELISVHSNITASISHFPPTHSSLSVYLLSSLSYLLCFVQQIPLPQPSCLSFIPHFELDYLSYPQNCVRIEKSKKSTELMLELGDKVFMTERGLISRETKLERHRRGGGLM